MQVMLVEGLQSSRPQFFAFSVQFYLTECTKGVNYALQKGKLILPLRSLKLLLYKICPCYLDFKFFAHHLNLGVKKDGGSSALNENERIHMFCIGFLERFHN